jgi:hypothetical protein
MVQIPQAVYPADIETLESLPPERLSEFLKYMDELDAEHTKAGAPYGDGSLWRITGAACWLGFFDDDYSAAEALAEDLSYATE